MNAWSRLQANTHLVHSVQLRKIANKVSSFNSKYELTIPLRLSLTNTKVGCVWRSMQRSL